MLLLAGAVMATYGTKVVDRLDGIANRLAQLVTGGREVELRLDCLAEHLLNLRQEAEERDREVKLFPAYETSIEETDPPVEPWDRLSLEERAKWIKAGTGYRKALEEEEKNPAGPCMIIPRAADVAPGSQRRRRDHLRSYGLRHR
jgi:hypothetical protein